jgi:hypothetical protein
VLNSEATTLSMSGNAHALTIGPPTQTTDCSNRNEEERDGSDRMIGVISADVTSSAVESSG